MSSQLPLALRWPAQQRFDSYLPGDNAVVIALLREAAVSAHAPWVFVAGATGCGKTHLLIAACAAASAHGRGAQYLPLRSLHGNAADALRSVGGSDLLALDDVDAIVGNDGAEHALFDLYNRCKMEKSTLLFSAAMAPAQIGIVLPDLVSRLSSCTQAPLKPLSDDERRQVLRARAQTRGLILDDSVLDWLFARAQRDLGSLTALLDRLDRESLAAQRRITVPFLRGLLGGEP
jgi:DnaA family protein